jgi:hypothetical protein
MDVEHATTRQDPGALMAQGVERMIEFGWPPDLAQRAPTTAEPAAHGAAPASVTAQPGQVAETGQPGAHPGA